MAKSRLDSLVSTGDKIRQPKKSKTSKGKKSKKDVAKQYPKTNLNASRLKAGGA